MNWQIRIFFLVLFTALRTFLLSDGAVPKGYVRSETHFGEGFADFTDYCKYYYSEGDEEKFFSNECYSVVEAEDVELLIGYFDWFYQAMNAGGRLDEYNFDTDCISEGDCFYLRTMEGQAVGMSVYEKYDNYTVYFYDVEGCTLYYIHTNI